MTIEIRGDRDEGLDGVAATLEEYGSKHPQAQIVLYRQNAVSLRIRIVDPEFRGRSRAQREEEVWVALNQLPDETLQDLSILLLFTPEEVGKSMANYEFESPTASVI